MKPFKIPKPRDQFYDVMYKWQKKINLARCWIPEIELLQDFSLNSVMLKIEFVIYFWSSTQK